MKHHGDDVCGGSCVAAGLNSHTIPTVGNLRSKSFLFLPKSVLLATQTIAGDLDCHGDTVVRCGAHRPMEHI